MRQQEQQLRVWVYGVLLVVGGLLGGSAPASAQSEHNHDKEVAAATPVLWHEPGPIPDKDISWKSDPTRPAPAPPFTFVEEDLSGTKPKVRVRDATGTHWNVKLSGTDDPGSKGEVHAEVAAGRLMWVLGYVVEETHFMEAGKIEGVGRLARAATAIGPGGTFKAARFEKRPAHVTRTNDRWAFDSNPFEGTKELSGLMILMTMINNWDNGGTRNTLVLEVPSESGAVERWHVVSDLGSAFGRMDTAALIRNRSRWDLDDYRRQAFIDDASGTTLDLHYRGDGAIDKVPMAHARWFAGLITQLSAEQIRQVFMAAGAAPGEIDGFSAKLLEKIKELQAATAVEPAERAAGKGAAEGG